MRNAPSLLVFACMLICSAPLYAQTADPFGNPAARDPFGGPNQSPRAARESDATNRVQRIPANAIAAVEATKLPQRSSSEATVRIRATLNDKTTQTFVETPLVDAARTLSETHDIPILIDRRALEELGMSADTPISLSLKNVSLRSFLRLMLRDLDLTYMIKDEVMQITTIEAAEQKTVVEMYRFPAELTEKSDLIIKALTESVVPDAWVTLGGPCTVSAVDNVLIVAGTETLHEEVIEFLKKLQRAFEEHQAKQN